ncbi:MAG: ABC transporter ATP-binding protein [Acidimicrobiales bacterium]
MTEPSAITALRISKRYVKYDDLPLLLNALRPGRRTRRSTLWALRDVNFDVPRGETVGVIGQNGSGKSTLLRILGGVTAPTEGRVEIRGRVAPLISVGVGFHPELTGRENVYVNGTILGLTRHEIDARFDEIVDFAELAEFIDTPVKFYSSGMFVRLGFSVAASARPDVLLVDEVLAVGDLAFYVKSFDRMQELRAAGTTVLLVTHNLNAVRVLCPRTLVLDHGVVRYDGHTDEAISVYHDLLERGPVRGGPSSSGSAPVATVTKFALLGPDGSPTGHVDSDDEATLVLELDVFHALEGVIVGVNVANQHGQNVYADSTPWTGLGRVEPGSRLVCRVRLRPELVTGSYSASMGLADRSGAKLVASPRAIPFFVGGRPGVNGVADLHAHFDVRLDGRTLEIPRPT